MCQSNSSIAQQPEQPTWAEAFLFGGHDGQKPLKTVQSFTPEELKWTFPKDRQQNLGW